MTIKLKLITPTKKIEEIISEQTTNYLNRKIKKNYNRVVNSLRQKIPFWIRSQPEIQSLSAEGVPFSLNALFGLYNGDAAKVTDDIINAIKDSTSIIIEKINRKYQGRVEFNFQQGDFKNLLSLSSGHVVTEEGSDLHWLEWLLAEGDTAMIIGYQYKPKSSGRSGGGVMVEGSYFRVPPEYAGNINDNFITRAFSNREKEIEIIMTRLFE